MLHTMMLAAALAYAHPEQLIDTAWVAAHARDANVRVVDVRRAGYEAGHIPDAFFLEAESIRDPKSRPTFLQAADAFAREMGRLGISNQTRVISYDDPGGLLASRLWWMLNVYSYATSPSLTAAGRSGPATSARPRPRPFYCGDHLQGHTAATLPGDGRRWVAGDR